MENIVEFEHERFFSSLSGYDMMFVKGKPLWFALLSIPSFLKTHKLDDNGNYIHSTAKIHPTAKIVNSYIAEDVQIYEFVTVRNSAVGSGSVIGHCSEVARSIIMSKCMIPRFNYIGSSIVGNVVEFGGVCSLASERFDNESVFIRDRGQTIDTKFLKFGSIVGDGCMIGFAVHCNPGTIIGRKSIIMPKVEVRGIIPEESIVSAQQRLIISKRRVVHELGLADLRARVYMEEI